MHAEDAYIGEIHSFEDVRHNGKVVDTLNFIRRGLPHFSPAISPATSTARTKRTNEAMDAMENQERYIVVTREGDSDVIHFNFNHDPPIFRVQSRLLLKPYGWPLTYFRDIPELLRVLKDAITGKHC